MAISEGRATASPAALPRPRAGGRGRRLGRLAGLALVLVGLALILYWASDFLVAGWRQHQDQARWLQLVSRAQAQNETPADLARPVDGIDFQLSVPKVGYSAVVREGVGLDVLASGPGHYPRSAWPGKPGNVGVAAHNAYWIQFNQLHPGDEVVVETRYGSFRYRVTGSRIVDPDDTSVLMPESGRQLTLTTCWPLWAGQLAWQRLAIFGSEQGAVPAPSGQIH